MRHEGSSENVGQDGILSHEFSSFQGVATRHEGSSENVGQDGIVVITTQIGGPGVSRLALWRTDAGEKSWLYPGNSSDAGAGNRRKRWRLFGRQRRVAAPAAIP